MTQAEIDRLIEILPECERLARRFSGCVETFEELRGIAIERAAQEAVRFTREPKRDWGAWAYVRIKGALLDHIRKEDFLTRKERKKARETGEDPQDPKLSLDAFKWEFRDHEAPCPAETLEHLERVKEVNLCLSSLHINHRHTLWGVHWLGMEKQEVAHLLGVCPATISRYYWEGVVLVRRWLNRRVA